MHRNISQLESDSDTDEVYGVHLGLLVRPIESLTIGLVYKSKETAEIDLNDEDLQYEIPTFVGIGLNYWITDKWHIAADVDYTEWSEFDDTVDYNKWVDIGSEEEHLRWQREDVTRYHFGTEYLLYLFGEDALPLPLRAGYYYEPTNALEDKRPTDNIDWDDDTEDAHHYTAGFGLLWERFQVDFAVDYSEIRTDFLVSAVYKF